MSGHEERLELRLEEIHGTLMELLVVARACCRAHLGYDPLEELEGRTSAYAQESEFEPRHRTEGELEE